MRNSLLKVLADTSVVLRRSGKLLNYSFKHYQGAPRGISLLSHPIFVKYISS